MPNPHIADFRPAYRTKVSAGIYGVMIYHLIEGSTVADLTEETGLRTETVRKYVNALYNQHALRIVRWDHDAAGRRTRAVYKIEIRSKENKDVPRPRMPAKERKARYKAKLKRARDCALQTIWNAKA